MKNIIVLTATRAEYGLLKPIIIKLSKEKNIKVSVVATGAHLSPEFGMTVREIENDGILIDKKIEILLSSDTAVSVSKSMGLAMISFAEYFAEQKPDALLVLGDRYETLAVCIAAMNERIPIIHLYGGETTEGAIDEAIRHAITKMSYLHFTSTEEYRRRVIQLGEDPQRVFNVGAMGVENALAMELMSKDELANSLGCNLAIPYVLGTFHPVTLENQSAEAQVKELIEAIKQYPDYVYLFTKANADANGRVINKMMQDYADCHENFYFFDSLGAKRYLSAIKYSEYVIGNSSSGLVEVPAFHKPTINIGDRQRGRMQGNSVINCSPQKQEIVNAIEIVTSDAFRNGIINEESPYGNGNTSAKIVEIVINEIVNGQVDIKKKFYDIM